MKWLLIIFSLFFRPFSRSSSHDHSSPAAEMKEFFIDNGKKVLLAMTITSLVSSLFVAGFVITIITLSAQYDQSGSFGLSAMILGGLGMMALSLIIGWIVFSPSRDGRSEAREREREVEMQNRHVSHNSVSDALVLLIQDFVKEREFNRLKQNSMTPEEAYYGGSRGTSEYVGEQVDERVRQ